MLHGTVPCSALSYKQMNTDRLNELFAKYIGNRLNEEEEIEFFELLDNPNNKERFESLFEALWETERQTKDKTLTEESLKRIDRTLKKLPRKKHTSYLPWFAAACMALLLMATYVLYQFYSDSEWDVTVQARHNLEYVSLPDGSLVILKKGSVLRYHEAFSEKRTLQVEGEAFFDVVLDANRPFLVQTKHLTTQVLGTAFSVNTVGDNEHVILLRGKVRVTSSDHSAVLTPNRQAVYVNNTLCDFPIDASAATAWSSDSFHIENQPLLRLTNILGARFGKEIVFKEEKTKNCLITTTFSMKDSFKSIMDVISLVNHVEWRMQGNKVLIYGKGCN